MKPIRPTLLLLAVLFPLAARAAEPTPPLVFAFNPFPPGKTCDAAGKPGGPYVEIVRELARRARLPLEIWTCPLKRCLAGMRAGRADLMIGIHPTPERRRYQDFLDPPFTVGNRLVLYQRRGDMRRIARYEDLLPLEIAVVDGGRYFPRFDADSRLRRDPGDSLEAGLRKLQAGRVDVVIAHRQQLETLSDGPLLAAALRQSGLEFRLRQSRYVSLAYRSPYYARKAQFADILRQMRRDGTVRRLLATAPRQARACR
ncbi:hypothetical protein CEK28_01860 [Xenophilus sp. AP218F]|nr:hypothetical protein CEK28_01860 [Xenophilus sp. AP218F]